MYSKKKKKKKKHLKKTNNFFSRILILRFDSNKTFLRNLVSPWNWKSFLVVFSFHGFQTSTEKQRKFRYTNISCHKVNCQSIISQLGLRSVSNGFLKSCRYQLIQTLIELQFRSFVLMAVLFNNRQSFCSFLHVCII